MPLSDISLRTNNSPNTSRISSKKCVEGSVVCLGVVVEAVVAADFVVVLTVGFGVVVSLIVVVDWASWL